MSTGAPLKITYFINLNCPYDKCEFNGAKEINKTGAQLATGEFLAYHKAVDRKSKSRIFIFLQNHTKFFLTQPIWNYFQINDA